MGIFVLLKFFEFRFEQPAIETEALPAAEPLVPVSSQVRLTFMRYIGYN